jgi:ABC-type dipeptide/oligopeptide/nickel transport system ATPase component
MYRGRIVEEGPVRQILRAPVHDYTKALLAAVPGRGGAKAPPLRFVDSAGDTTMAGHPPTDVDRRTGGPSGAHSWTATPPSAGRGGPSGPPDTH